ncbi:MAG: CBS domain-containing protein [Candidatus Altiarchaeales archaeon]|nr:CBS domain-containing protein [Candidatus Altiarchaeales archaeon]MBD3416888.1 CBS domain-containing protein [Candidatus Altiarchaeales archaeon]
MIEDVLGRVKQQYQAVQSDTRVSEVVGVMSKQGLYAVPVLDGNTYVGLITASDIVASRNPTSTKARTIASRVPLVPKDSGVGEVCERMWRNSLIAVPVGEGDRIEGLITFWDILEWAVGKEDLKDYLISDVDIGEFPEIPADEDLDSARVNLRTEDISKLVVGDERMKRLIDEKEYAERISRIPKRRAKTGERRGEKVKMLASDAKNISERILVHARRTDELGGVLERMIGNRVTHAKVDEGIVTYRDILRFLADTEEEDKTRSQKVKVICKHQLPESVKSRMDSELRDFAGYYADKHGLESLKELKINVKETNRGGSNRTYEMKANMVTDRGRLHAKKTGWDAINVFNELVAALKKSIRRGD